MYIGNDILYIPRFYHWAEYSEQKLLKIFTQEELQECRNRCVRSHRKRLDSSLYLASRFAAKEAIYKACSFAGMQTSLYAFLRTCRVTNDEAGRPCVALSDDRYSVQVSLSHDGDYIMAVALVTRR